MNNNLLLPNIFRFVVLVLLQVLVFKRMNIWNTSILIYPVFLMLLPVELPAFLGIILGFLFGLTIDMFYDSPGIHAGTCVFLCYFRYYILGLFEPKGGYPPNSGPTQYKLGVSWFFQYAALFTAIHLFVYFSIEAFSFVYILEILLKTVLSFLFSMIFIMLYQFLLNPKD